MPIYEYKCSSCGNEFEKMQSINNDERITECPSCKGQAERKYQLQVII